MRFEILADEPVAVHASEPLASFYQLSPFVWRDNACTHVMLRAVNYSDVPAEKIARIYHGTTPDGLNFYMDAEPAIAPGPHPQDRDGCEDPTVALFNQHLYVYYTGWNEAEKRGRLMLAVGAEPGHLDKRGVALDSRPECENPKEAEIARARDGTWRLFFEFAAQGASRIGIASSSRVDGPWELGDPPFERRAGSWDDWHLSTGPAVTMGGTPVMFYNGATKEAQWRIGWIRFDPDYGRVLDRCAAPVVEPKKPKGDETDIAFASSAVREGDLIRLYYSVADQYMRRVTLKAID